MSLFDNEYEMNEEVEELFEDFDEEFEAIFESMDGDDDFDEESSYFFDESLLEATKKKTTKKKTTKKKTAKKKTAKKKTAKKKTSGAKSLAFDMKVRFDDNMKSLIKERRAIVDLYKNKLSGGTRLKYLKARKNNGLSIIDAKIARYQKRLDLTNESMSIVESFQESLMENLMEAFKKEYTASKKQLATRFEPEKGSDTNGQKAAALKGRYHDDNWKKNNLQGSTGAGQQRKKDFATLLDSIKGKQKADKEVLDARATYYQSQITNFSNLRTAFAAYMDAYMAHYVGKIEKARSKRAADLKEKKEFDAASRRGDLGYLFD